MKINLKPEQTEQSFRSLSPGEMFRSNGELYIKTVESLEVSSNNYLANCIHILTGSYERILLGSPVTRVSVLSIEEKF